MRGIRISVQPGLGEIQHSRVIDDQRQIPFAQFVIADAPGPLLGKDRHITRLDPGHIPRIGHGPQFIGVGCGKCGLTEDNQDDGQKEFGHDYAPRIAFSNLGAKPWQKWGCPVRVSNHLHL